jgi:hypothetical protein
MIGPGGGGGGLVFSSSVPPIRSPNFKFYGWGSGNKSIPKTWM